MNELTTQSQTISSLEIAEMMEVSHRDVMRKIDGSTDRKGYIEILGEAQMGVTDYFIKSTYLTDQNKELSCYLITKMGCEFLANKFTGEKGVIFSAKYVKRFNEMEQHIQSPSLTYSNLSPQLQLLINIETQQKQQELALIDTNKRIDNMQDVIALDTTTWRKSAKDLISKIALKMGGFEYIHEINTEINKLVNLRCGVSLETRLTNKRRRMAEEGICKSKRDKLTKVDIIAEDKKLIEVYVAIIKEMAVKNGISVSELKCIKNKARKRGLKIMDKFILKSAKANRGYKPAIIDVDTWEKLNQLKEETGIPMTKILSQAVDFALERIEVVDEAADY